ncbi:response regulator transcription factor [Paenibacillus montanisoli]|uniref:DNA-binding response regulator n=1 Tax=Paenibacillus montanisoli TaxID=2081970 RepID=A0A328U9P5_9BACL|nr:response regulator transcription factor [Paenibacillus montanisoli]RAP77645.1 DNA-binding response regulator [Paenibacillus montanisoli]
MLFKVLITDDEPTIREGLKTLIDWEELGFEVVGTAANGKDALGKFEGLAPDLMIVDIRMPGMSGLELIEQLRKNGHAVHVMILSGYADFEYAKKAITLDTDGYLLKPVDEDELVDYLKKLRVTLASESEAKQKSSMQEQLNREWVVQSLLTPGGQVPEEDALARADLIWDSYAVLLFKPLNGQGQLPALRSRIVSQYEETGKGVVFMFESCVGLLLKDNPKLEPVRKGLQISLLQLSDIEFAAAAGSAVKKLADLQSSFDEAVKLLEQRFFYEEDQLLTGSSVPIKARMTAADGAAMAEPEGEDFIVYCDETAEKLYLAVDIGNKEAYASLVGAAGKHLLEHGSSEQELKAAMAHIVTGVISKLSQRDPELQSRSGELSAGILAIHQTVTYRALERHVIDFVSRLNPGVISAGTDKQVKKLLDLIQRNYAENLKLESLADVFNYNSAYLGKLFKSATGEYFNTYVDKVRVEKAKELLGQGMKVYQVAEMVGYSNVDYFHSKFRKYVGSAPSAYRKR